MPASDATKDEPAPGWFGKVPMLGDFAHRRLAQGVVTRLDAWLSQGLLQSRATLGAAWLDAYLGAPQWCFVCAPNVLDERWWLGVLTPNVDAAGRYFPLMVLAPQGGPPCTPDGLDHAVAWCAAAAQCAVDTLAPHATLHSFEQALHGVNTSSSASRLTDPALSAWMQHHMTGQSLWWAHAGSAPQAPGTTLHMARGLPAPDRFAAMWGSPP
jgi:type VI secretion system protein ImpM